MTQTRQQRIESVRIMVEYNWMYLRHLYASVCERLGESGIEAMNAGFRQHGRYRGESIRNSAKGCATPRDAATFLQCWDTAELLLASRGECLQPTRDGDRVIAQLERMPGREYFADKGDATVLQLYWRELLTGIAAGYDEALSIQTEHLDAGADKTWELELTFNGLPSSQTPVDTQDKFSDPVTAIDISRRTAGVFSGLCMHTTQALMQRFGGTGEEVARTALYNFGAERAVGMREQAERDGRTLDFNSWFDIISERDPNSSAWVFRGDTHISAGVFQVTCTYCPMAEVWAEFGPDGLALGYVYDMEVHRGLVEAFNPEGVVAWEKVKTRGDRVCNFRFSIPSLVTDDDPPWARGLRNT